MKTISVYRTARVYMAVILLGFMCTVSAINPHLSGNNNPQKTRVYIDVHIVQIDVESCFPSTYNIIFSVVDGNGQALLGAKIVMHLADHEMNVWEAETDEAGTGILGEMEAGNYIYAISLEGYHPVNEQISLNDEHVHIKVVLEMLTYNISTTIVPVYGGIVEGSGTYPYGEKVSLLAKPSEGHHFVGWEENGAIISTDTIFNFVASHDRELKAVFALTTFSVLFNVSDDDGIDISDAIITMNDTAYEAGKYLFEDLLPGSYTYHVYKEGYAVASGSFELTADNAEIPVVLTSVTSADIARSTAETVQIVPNPSTGHFNIYMRGLQVGEAIQVRVFDGRGHLITQHAFLSTDIIMNAEIDLKGVQQGVFFVHVTSSYFAVVRKVIVVKNM